LNTRTLILITSAAALAAILGYRLLWAPTPAPLTPSSDPSPQNSPPIETESPEIASPQPTTTARSDIGTTQQMEVPEIVRFFAIPEEKWEKLPADCLLPLDALSADFDLNALDIEQLEYDFQAWNLSRGFRTEALFDINGQANIVTDYDGYSLDTLLALAEQNDMLASQMVGEKLLRQNKLDEAEQHLTNAAILGSSKAFQDLMDIELHRKHRAKQDNKRTNTNKNLNRYDMNALVWNKLGRKRGGLNLYFDVRDTQSSELSEEQLQQVEMKVTGLYQSYTMARESKGLPFFDNQLPVLAQMINSFYETMKDCNPDNKHE